MNRITAAVLLPLRFVRALVVSGVQTVQAIVGHSLGRAPTTPRLVDMPFGPLSATGAVLLASMVTLTPGTTVVHIDLPRRLMRLHLLDGADPEATFADIRREFEVPLLAWFGCSAACPPAPDPTPLKTPAHHD